MKIPRPSELPTAKQSNQATVCSQSLPDSSDKLKNSSTPSKRTYSTSSIAERIGTSCSSAQVIMPVSPSPPTVAECIASPALQTWRLPSERSSSKLGT